LLLGSRFASGRHGGEKWFKMYSKKKLKMNGRRLEARQGVISIQADNPMTLTLPPANFQKLSKWSQAGLVFEESSS
jgi:hypothetical protein